jgi:hypothetical protein
MIKKITMFAGLLLAGVGSLGFVAPDVMNLNPAQSAFYLLSGVTALYFALAVSPGASRIFCFLFGGLYTFLGLAGVGLGGLNQTLTLVPGQLVFQTMDHVFHLVLGAMVLIAGLTVKMAAPIPVRITNKRD